MGDGFSFVLAVIFWVALTAFMRKAFKKGKDGETQRIRMFSNRSDFNRMENISQPAERNDVSEPLRKMPQRIVKADEPERIRYAISDADGSETVSAGKMKINEDKSGMFPFEDRKYDWLARQIEEEKRLSMCGPLSMLDGGPRGAARLNRLEHEVDCDAEYIREKHARACNAAAAKEALKSLFK